MKNYLKNKKHLTENNAYDPSLEHEACEVSTRVDGTSLIKRVCCKRDIDCGVRLVK